MRQKEQKVRAADTVSHLDSVGPIGLGVDRETHEILIMTKTPVGAISESLTKEQALELGVKLVRISGVRFRFPVSTSASDHGNVKPDPE